MQRRFQEAHRASSHNSETLSHQSSGLASIAQIWSQADRRVTSVHVLSRPRLVAQWQVVDGQLTCQWIAE